jgi:hypothetical protein
VKGIWSGNLVELRKDGSVYHFKTESSAGTLKIPVEIINDNNIWRVYRDGKELKILKGWVLKHK